MRQSSQKPPAAPSTHPHTRGGVWVALNIQGHTRGTDACICLPLKTHVTPNRETAQHPMETTSVLIWRESRGADGEWGEGLLSVYRNHQSPRPLLCSQASPGQGPSRLSPFPAAYVLILPCTPLPVPGQGPPGSNAGERQAQTPPPPMSFPSLSK